MRRHGAQHRQTCVAPPPPPPPPPPPHSLTPPASFVLLRVPGVPPSLLAQQHEEAWNQGGVQLSAVVAFERGIQRSSGRS